MSRVLVVLGPTAVGKSALALALAERLDGEIINADALQVYRGFDLGTAKPTAEELARVPHHLIDLLEPAERYSAGEFARRARAIVPEIFARGRLPLVVGGSGLYLRALLEGISPLPEPDREVRSKLRRRLADEGLPALRAELLRADPPTAARLAPGDSQRTLRALEVFFVSGRPLSAWLAERPFGSHRMPALRVGLTLPRSILYDRIQQRVGSMVGKGWVKEVEELLDDGLDPSLPAFQAIGYRQLAAHVRGEQSLESALHETVRATCRFAKRQQTWYRKEPDVTWFDAADRRQALTQVMEFLDRSSLRGAYGQTEH